MTGTYLTQKLERKTALEREEWFTFMRKVDDLMCKQCGSLTCLCDLINQLTTTKEGTKYADL